MDPTGYSQYYNAFPITLDNLNVLFYHQQEELCVAEDGKLYLPGFLGKIWKHIIDYFYDGEVTKKVHEATVDTFTTCEVLLTVDPKNIVHICPLSVDILATEMPIAVCILSIANNNRNFPKDTQASIDRIVTKYNFSALESDANINLFNNRIVDQRTKYTFSNDKKSKIQFA